MGVWVCACVCVCFVHVCLFVRLSLSVCAGMTCEISAENKMAAGKIPLIFLPFSSSMIRPMQKITL